MDLEAKITDDPRGWADEDQSAVPFGLLVVRIGNGG